MPSGKIRGTCAFIWINWFAWVLLSAPGTSAAQSDGLPPWRAGYLDIHHINTGSGNAAFFIFPDGTTMLFDAGDVDRLSRSKTPNPLRIAPRLPHDSVSAGRSIVQYIRAATPFIHSIDYALISHFHPDHYGSITAQSKNSVFGQYRLSGITEVNEYVPISRLIDRDFPLYQFPVDIKTRHFDKETFVNYFTFVQELLKKGSRVEALKAGSDRQITLMTNPGEYPGFRVRNIKVNGDVWSGVDEGVTHILPATIEASDYNENPLSLALKISYGKFDYFTGGDMTGLNGTGIPSWFDVETPVARVVGRVEALSLNHHGVRDATNEFFLRTLAPQVIIQQSWSSNHPGEEVLHRIISSNSYPGKRDIFATYIHEETTATYGRWLDDNYQSKRGHIVIRVSPPGDAFSVYVLDDIQPGLKIVRQFGPYTSQ